MSRRGEKLDLTELKKICRVGISADLALLLSLLLSPSDVGELNFSL
jgi:hypothetical protein